MIGLGNLFNLEVLDLSTNFIEKIDGLISCKKLTKLVLFGNRITHVENLHGLSMLNTLYL